MARDSASVRWDPEKDLMNEARLEKVGAYAERVRGVRASRIVYAVLHIGGASTGAIVCQDFNNFLLHTRGDAILTDGDVLSCPNSRVVFPTLGRLCGLRYVDSGPVELSVGEVHYYETTSIRPKGPMKIQLPERLRLGRLAPVIN